MRTCTQPCKHGPLLVAAWLRWSCAANRLLGCFSMWPRIPSGAGFRFGFVVMPVDPQHKECRSDMGADGKERSVLD
jgi:hypothetical protein